jgi:hypothetical protein
MAAFFAQEMPVLPVTKITDGIVVETFVVPQMQTSSLMVVVAAKLVKSPWEAAKHVVTIHRGRTYFVINVMMEGTYSSRTTALVNHAQMLFPIVEPVLGSLTTPSVYFVRGIINYLDLRSAAM